MRSIDTATQLCAVIGNPVEHSLSPCMHNAAFEAAGLNYVYVAFQVEDVAGCLAGMRALPSFRGMSVTIPHKIAVMPHLDAIDPMAVNVGSVNTIVNEGGRLVGSTTDGLGTLRVFDEAGVSLKGKRVLFIGAGGAVRSVAFALAERAGVTDVTILGRTESRVTTLVNDLKAKTDIAIHPGSLPQDIEPAMTQHDVVIQGTPIGMYPHNQDETIVPAGFFRPEQIVFDMVYRPLKTRLIREAETAGCRTILGIEMLLQQAVLQFEAWTGIDAPVEVMRKSLLATLEQEE